MTRLIDADEKKKLPRCAICGKKIKDEKPVKYDGDLCHYKCAHDDNDAVGSDADFGDN